MPPASRLHRCSSMLTSLLRAASTTPFASFFPIRDAREGSLMFPATHAGGPSGPASAPPYGVHFRLKSSFDMSQLSPPAQVVARAMQKYGMFLADGGRIALTAQSDQTRWPIR